MLTSASQLVHRARCVPASSASRLGLSSVAVRRHRQQVREFRFGRSWVTYFDLDSTRDPGPHCKSPRYRYASKGKKWKGEKYYEADNPPALNPESNPLRKTPENPEGIRPGRNIEDVERAPLEGLLFGKHGRHLPGEDWDSPLPSVDDLRRPELEHTINPITTSKVPKATTEVPSATPDRASENLGPFKSYRSQFTSLKPPMFKSPQAPIFFDGPPPEAELKAYAQIKLDEPIPTPGEAKRASQSEQAGHNKAPVSELLGTLSEKHGDVFWHRSGSITLPISGPSTDKSWTLSPTDHQYNDLRKYQPVGDEALCPASESAVEKYDDLDKYDVVSYHEPDGKMLGKEPSPDLNELGEYNALRAHEPDGKYKVESEPLVDSEELKRYGAFRSHEPDGMYSSSYREMPGTDELARYSQPYLSHEPDGMYAAEPIKPVKDEELSGYEPFRSHEPNGKYVGSPESAPEAEELETYQPFASHEPDGKYADASNTPAPQPEELDQYQAVRSHEPNGKYVDQTEAAEDSDLGNHEAFDYEDSETKASFTGRQGDEGSSELDEYKPVHHNEPDGKSAESGDGGYDPAEMKEYEAVMWNEPDGKPAQTKPEDKTHHRQMLEQQHTLTGNYVRDFPEFAKSWSTEGPESNSALLPRDFAPSEGVTTPAGALQPALERRHNVENSATKMKAETQNEPTLYKILVYDPTMQCIDVAETTSIVADGASPLTPTEVLLRISNPSKFLPHFGPLKAQGFEILSGAGDVLIFRKVHDAAVQPAAAVKGTTAAAMETISAPPVNPIDMTGGEHSYSVAAGRFASPTGFVNYDLPPSRFESNIDVRREEPVFSGPKTEPVKKKTSVSKRVVVGAVWVAGISYSIGLVGEYLAAGGVGW
ncbi:hypothetical protein B0H67DRAFT_489192 [Lasiosphaeris hirsuta]|uniref:Uncharacterized protein n=1 Tax=Lasiosphaeris hirsuta TaxID=260670 RepID=A0AA40AGA0_9PEZI|nr:hypothetical protein B0H67DRAFT_489192 [Lasiosphaeris hirsuta]